MIGSIITNIVNTKSAPLQIYPGVLAHEKKLFDWMQKMYWYKLTADNFDTEIHSLNGLR